jgi:serine protein kinase
MEAFRDRTIKIDMPYNIKLDDEIQIYEKDFNKEGGAGCTSPRTRSRWRRCGRCSRARRAQEGQSDADAEAQALQRQERAGLHRGRSRSCARKSPREGMQGISPRYVQDKISNALVSDQAQQENASTPSW